MKIKLFFFFVVLVQLSGCVGNKPPHTQIFTISPVWHEGKGSIKKISPYVLKLAPIRAAQALTSTDLLYSDGRYVINSYAYSHWNDQPAILLQMRFQVGLEESNLFKAVMPPTSSSTADLLLESSLLDFSHHLNEGEASEGVCRIRFYLIDNLSKAIIETREFTAKIPAVSNNAQGAVKALNEATTVVTDELVSWLAELRKMQSIDIK